MTAPATSIADAARARRAELQATAHRRSLLLPAAVIGLWLTVMTVTGQLGRAGDNLAAAATMVFGSFVAGSTPQGGGAVAFPVFTKVLGVAAADARTFSLAIQAVGMGTAAAIIGIARRPVDAMALRYTVPSAVAGFLFGWVAFSIATPSGPILKLAFTLVVVAAGAATVLSRRDPLVEQLRAVSLESARRRNAVVVAAFLGGVASALFGSGADIAVYLVLTVALGLRPSIGVATSVVTMAAVSIVGLATMLLSGTLALTIPVGDSVDVTGMWFAAIPVVVLGAPIGSWFASRVAPAVLARFIGGLAALELVSTLLFLEELRTDPFLAVAAIAGLLGTAVAVRYILTVRAAVATGRPVHQRSVRRLDLDVEMAR